MTLDKMLASLFPNGHDVKKTMASFSARRRCDPAPRPSSSASRTGPPLASTRPSGCPDTSWIPSRKGGPILVLVDSDSQRMSKRDEMLGLNEYLAHLAKSLMLRGFAQPADHRPSVRPLGRGRAARHGTGNPGAGGFAGCRACSDGSAFDGEVTKLSIEALQEKAKSISCVCPGSFKSCPDGRCSDHLERCCLTCRPVGSAAWQLTELA